ncbi:MAG: hypothetical protein JWO67_4168 [Streptosporangiaceae bacterium]|nr:hypothetical protein [Streptosporangiaceae bacterium]
MTATGARRGHLVYHWKHGWIPLDHFAALSKAKGSHAGAAKIMEKHGIAKSVPTGELRRSPHIGAARVPGGGVALRDSQTGHHVRISSATATSLHAQGSTITGVHGSMYEVRRRDGSTIRFGGLEDTPAKPTGPRLAHDGRLAMDAAAYKAYSDKVSAQRLSFQPKMDATAKDLPEAQARQLLDKYRAVVKQHSIGFGEYDNRSMPSAEEIKTLAHAHAAVKALSARVAVFDTARAASRGKAPATDAQIAHIQRLLARRKRTGEGGGFMTVGGDLRTLTKAQASAYIDSLSGNY